VYRSYFTATCCREGIRTDTYKYVEYDSGDRELFDLKADPYKVNNIYESADAPLLENLQARLDGIRACTALSSLYCYGDEKGM
jgi:N-acetylglucosamine-6-sulfatase